jgi:hypothetical protein
MLLARALIVGAAALLSHQLVDAEIICKCGDDYNKWDDGGWQGPRTWVDICCHESGGTRYTDKLVNMFSVVDTCRGEVNVAKFHDCCGRLGGGTAPCIGEDEPRGTTGCTGFEGCDNPK